MEIFELVEKLLAYGEEHLHLKKRDFNYTRNLILKELNLEGIYKGEVNVEEIKELKVPDTLLEPLRKWMVDNLSITEAEAERKTDYIMGLLSPIPSTVEGIFNALYKVEPVNATNYLYDLSIKNDYIKKSRVDKNIHYNAHFEKGSDLEISINLSKPEKSNKDIAAALNTKSSGYPECLLCPTNEGFAGNAKHPSRGNLRTIALKLGGRDWFLQYSPYVYYNEHCIVFLDEHVPMHVGELSINSLLDFVDIFPHYFLGSNSDLPIVGGSILSHQHFQGGGYDLPLLKANFLRTLKGPSSDVVIHEVDFYNTVLCLESSSKEALAKEALRVHLLWKGYNDEENDIIASSDKGQHSTSTLIARKVDGKYRLYMILRNNRCDETYPDGIFHVHPEFKHIKQEGIGLIEAAGLFILPARLLRQSKEVEEVAKTSLSYEEILKKYPDLDGFNGMIASLRRGLTARGYIAGVCRYILDNTAVFKKDEKGAAGLNKFLKEAGYGI